MTQNGVYSAPAARPRRFDTAQVAKRYNKCSKTIRRWVTLGKLGAYVTCDTSPNAQRYEFDEAQLAEFESRHWRRTDQPLAAQVPAA